MIQPYAIISSPGRRQSPPLTSSPMFHTATSAFGAPFFGQPKLKSPVLSMGWNSQSSRMKPFGSNTASGRMKPFGEEPSVPPDYYPSDDTEIVDDSDILIDSIQPVQSPEGGWDPTQDPELTSTNSNPDGKSTGSDILESMRKVVGTSVVDTILKAGEGELKALENRGAAAVYTTAGYKTTGQTVVRKTDKVLGTVMTDINGKAVVLFADSVTPESFNPDLYDSKPVSNAGVAAALKPAAAASNTMLIVGVLLLAVLFLRKR